ncbi:hypothetical protein QAD02_021164 [Eretmocerus hayati]|uniref:Uncharacterized protein n=1 Tax=Eretmocerus hayati TaxID=131215 RepID=A0ACC2PPE6_9HYME|nr:hypothetical protein QAD02_021164 [Eretmocerus hayati]
MNLPLARFKILALTLLYTSVENVDSNGDEHLCPPVVNISPCTCSIKKNGLDIICEFTDFEHISRAMDSLKKRKDIIIFYLKLRHNDLPKLQGFMFFGLYVHHLTIHNSSLAVLEESSLSSIGES